jgi:hypothetical protein
MEQHEVTRERIEQEIALVKREKLERQLERQRRNSCGPKTREGKATSSANNQARSPVWSIKCTSAQAGRFAGRNNTLKHRAGIAAALTEAGLPFKEVKLTAHWRLKVSGLCVDDRGWVKVHIVGKVRPWSRYGEIVGAYCQSVIDAPDAPLNQT